jgi:hypothetical protein
MNERRPNQEYSERKPLVTLKNVPNSEASANKKIPAKYSASVQKIKIEKEEDAEGGKTQLQNALNEVCEENYLVLLALAC